MKKDIETRGRPRNNTFVNFCEQLEADLYLTTGDAEPSNNIVVSGVLLSGEKREYLSFRKSASMTALKKRLRGEGLKSSLYFQDGTVYLKVRKS